MAGLVLSNVSSSLVKENVQGSTIDTVFRRTDLLDFLRGKGKLTTFGGANPVQWNIVSAANTSSEVFVEGQAPAIAGKQTYQRASLAPFYVRTVGRTSGHIKDQVKAGGVYTDPVQDAIDKAIADTFKLVDDTLCGTTQDRGIQSIIDADDTYAGLAPGSVTSWAAKETGSAGTLGVDDIEDLAEALALAPYLANPTDILCCHNQITNYTRTIGPSASTSLFRFGPGQKFDAGVLGGDYLQGGVSWNGIPFTGINGLTNTVLLMLDMNSGVNLAVHRDILVEPYGKSSDDDEFQVTFACALKVDKRNAHGKLTGITA
jgi:hypothetical protein